MFVKIATETQKMILREEKCERGQVNHFILLLSDLCGLQLWTYSDELCAIQSEFLPQAQCSRGPELIRLLKTYQ